MGFFTWTLANRKPVILRCGEYAARCKLRYDGYGAILCPDNTLIKEPCYDGYGIFDGKDVYELVVDWNRDHLTDILNHPNYKPSILNNDAQIELMKAYQNNDSARIDALIAQVAADMPFMRTDWKRNIGINIACGHNNFIIPYPIKIVDLKRAVNYKDLPPSITTQ